MREPQKGFASDCLHVQIKALCPGAGISVPGECDSGAVRGDCGSGLLPRKGRKWNRSEGLEFRPTVPFRPTKDDKNSHCQDC